MMESIEQMIKRLCPEGIKFVKLGEVCEVLRGKRLTKKELFDDAQYKVFHGGLSPIGYYTKANRQAQTVMVINVGASAGTVGFCDEEFWSSDGCFCLSHNDDVTLPKYLYYYLADHQLSIQSRVRKAGIPTLDASAVKDLEIPLPPLAIQNRIVEVLDKMTTLTAELEAELEARKQQYEYYRNKLLIFNEIGGGIRLMKLGEVGKFYGGLSGKSKNDFVDGNAKFITYMNVYSNPSLCVNVDDKVVIKEGEKQNTIQFGDILFTGSSETPDECGMSSVLTTHVEEKLYLNSFCFGYRFDDLTDINPHFMKHLFRSASVRKVIAKTANGVTRFNVSKKLFAEIVIPVPSMEEQSRIVSILDRFEALTTNLQDGLPAEIEARRQQYEYYRNKLLTFDKVA